MVVSHRQEDWGSKLGSLVSFLGKTYLPSLGNLPEYAEAWMGSEDEVLT